MRETMCRVGNGAHMILKAWAKSLKSRCPRVKDSARDFAHPTSLLAGALLLGLASAPAAAADFYAGKTLNFVVGTDVGGGFSIYARAIGKHLGRHIPGNPTVVVKNMPGAGGSTSAAWLYRMAPKDGTAILSVSPNAIL